MIINLQHHHHYNSNEALCDLLVFVHFLYFAKFQRHHSYLENNKLKTGQFGEQSDRLGLLSQRAALQ